MTRAGPRIKVRAADEEEAKRLFAEAGFPDFELERADGYATFVFPVIRDSQIWALSHAIPPEMDADRAVPSGGPKPTP